MYFDYCIREPEKVSFDALHIGDVFRYNDTLYIKLKGCSVLKIYDDDIIEMKNVNSDVELVDYKIIIYSEE